MRKSKIRYERRKEREGCGRGVKKRDDTCSKGY